MENRVNRMLDLMNRLERVISQLPRVLRANELYGIDRIHALQARIAAEMEDLKNSVTEIPAEMAGSFQRVRSRIENAQHINRILLQDTGSTAEMFFSRRDKGRTYNASGKQPAGSKFCAVNV